MLQAKKTILVNIIRKSILSGVSPIVKAVDLNLELGQILVGEKNLSKKLNNDLGYLREKIFILQGELERLEEKIEFDTLRKVFNTLIISLERPMKNYIPRIESLGITPINPQFNEPFNSQLHEPIEESESEKIESTLRIGFSYKSKCLRPALVRLQNLNE